MSGESEVPFCVVLVGTDGTVSYVQPNETPRSSKYEVRNSRERNATFVRSLEFIFIKCAELRSFCKSQQRLLVPCHGPSASRNNKAFTEFQRHSILNASLESFRVSE